MKKLFQLRPLFRGPDAPSWAPEPKKEVVLDRVETPSLPLINNISSGYQTSQRLRNEEVEASKIGDWMIQLKNGAFLKHTQTWEYQKGNGEVVNADQWIVIPTDAKLKFVSNPFDSNYSAFSIESASKWFMGTLMIKKSWSDGAVPK